MENRENRQNGKSTDGQRTSDSEQQIIGQKDRQTDLWKYE